MDGYAVLYCWIICALYFSIIATQKEAQQLLTKEPGESILVGGLYTRYWDMLKPKKDDDLWGRRTVALV